MYYEYKIIRINDMPLDIIEEKLNSLANKKWRVINIASASRPEDWGSFIILEREIK